MVIGDFTAKVAENASDIWSKNARKFGSEKIDEQGKYCIQFLTSHNLLITTTLLRHNPSRRSTWLHPNGLYQINHH